MIWQINYVRKVNLKFTRQNSPEIDAFYFVGRRLLVIVVEVDLIFLPFPLLHAFVMHNEIISRADQTWSRSDKSNKLILLIDWQQSSIHFNNLCFACLSAAPENLIFITLNEQKSKQNAKFEKNELNLSHVAICLCPGLLVLRNS